MIIYSYNSLWYVLQWLDLSISCEKTPFLYCYIIHRSKHLYDNFWVFSEKALTLLLQCYCINMRTLNGENIWIKWLSWWKAMIRSKWPRDDSSSEHVSCVYGVWFRRSWIGALLFTAQRFGSLSSTETYIHRAMSPVILSPGCRIAS